jgi:hypothetical protein
MLACVLTPARAAIILIDSFNPAGVTELAGIGYDHVAERLYLYASGDDEILRYTRTGTADGSIPRPGNSSNDFDLDFTTAATNLGGTAVAADTLLVGNGDSAGIPAYALNKTTGAILASVNLSGTLVGLSWNTVGNTLLQTDWTSDLLRIRDPGTGGQLTSFPVQPGGSPPFDVFFGDADVLRASGDIYVVSSSQTRIRVLSQAGAFLGDIDVAPLGVSGMSGIAFDDARGEAWISSTNGNVYHLGGFDRFVPGAPIPEPGTVTLFAAGVMAVFVSRRLRARTAARRS